MAGTLRSSLFTEAGFRCLNALRRASTLDEVVMPLEAPMPLGCWCGPLLPLASTTLAVVTMAMDMDALALLLPLAVYYYDWNSWWFEEADLLVSTMGWSEATLSIVFAI